MSTPKPAHIIAEHRYVRRWSDHYPTEACTGCDWSHPGVHPHEADRLHAVHVAALTDATKGDANV